MTGKPAGARANRDGDPWQRADGRWSARVWPADGNIVTGSKPKYVYGATRGEVLARLHKERYDEEPPARAKTTRITIDLAEDDYHDLNRWVGSAAIAVNPDLPRLSQAAAVRAMIKAAVADTVVTGVVLGLLRKDQAPSSG